MIDAIETTSNEIVPALLINLGDIVGLAAQVRPDPLYHGAGQIAG